MMDGFMLLCGHLVGDYLVQNDWMAANKTNPHPGPEPHPNRIWMSSTTPARPYPGPWSVDANPRDREKFKAALEERNNRIDAWNKSEDERVHAYTTNYDLQEQKAWWAARDKYRIGHVACFIHCALYTLAVWAFTFWWMPWWGLLVVLFTHFPIDRWRLASRIMLWTGQAKFASSEHPLFPWSIVLVDNIYHLVVLAVVAAFARS